MAKTLEEHLKICETCWSCQKNVAGRSCQGCINENKYENVDEVKDREDKIRKNRNNDLAQKG